MRFDGRTDLSAADDTVRVGLIGYGYVAKTFHAPMITATPGLQLAAVASSRAADVHADHPGVHVVDADELIARGDVDVVVIASPNDTHRPLAEAALMDPLQRLHQCRWESGPLCGVLPGRLGLAAAGFVGCSGSPLGAVQPAGDRGGSP